jgi:16S rRNA (guanine966-N2)-methyltransferase
VRVVAGEAKGRALSAPKGASTRPTSDRVREAIFDVLGSLVTVAGADVVDLFAGSGALGIEALSRGASHAVFVDRDRYAVDAIRANLAATGMAATRATVMKTDVRRWLAGARAASVDLVLCDPPYDWAGWAPLLPAVRHVLEPSKGLVVLETGHPIELGGDWQVLTVKQYGGTVVTVARPAARGGM